MIGQPICPITNQSTDIFKSTIRQMVSVITSVENIGIVQLVQLLNSWSSVGEWLGRMYAVLGVDGSSILTATQRCEGLSSPFA